MYNRRLLSFFGLVALATASPLSTHSIPSTSNSNQVSLAPLVESATNPILNSYIVVLKDDVSPAAFNAHTNFVQNTHAQAQATDDVLEDIEHGLKHVYDSHFKGYAGTFAQSTVDKIRARPEVNYVEVDQVVHTLNITVQKSAPWGLARVSHRPRLSFGTFTTYQYDPQGGEGVTVYVIDTGININHIEFEGRASWGTTVPRNDVDEDGNGHGTHCAGTIASRAYGVAKGAKVTAVKVLGSNGSGSMSDVVGGVFWAVNDAKAKEAAAAAEFKATGKTKYKGSVANMSLGGGKSRALDDAVNRAVDGGLHFAVAAGNDNKDACDYSPAGARNPVTVGASTIVDERAYFSNFGPCVDVFAPGLNILSTWTGSTTARNTISGTSMASPHTAGMLAYLLSIYPSATFNPESTSKKSLLPSSLLETAVQAYPAFASLQRVYSIARAALPDTIAKFLPAPKDVFAVAPIPGPGFPTLSPKELKEALLDLASEDMLTMIPGDTPNLLIFNNATTPKW
ncbi:peptidase S8/S53 domain-containing protein [Gautieria morchelliformis]|nr:peptidase S8/S53 domain-containing protein [Gautieria morchelliformis]